MPKPEKYRFKRLDNIGAADAADDKLFLEKCFVDTGDLDALYDCSDPRRIVVGRTGSGKSALLIRLSECRDKVIEVRPESLALAYISNSTILRYFSELGVKLDIFFCLLWRHVFTVEILKHHFHIDNEDDKASFLVKVHNLFRDKKHTKALEYLEDWGKKFWEATEYRIKEVTTKLEEDLAASVKVKLPSIVFTTDAAQKLTEEQKQEVIQRAQYVVNDVQIRQLSDILQMVDELLSDRQKRYYILIDRLDENWIEDRLRYHLIRALIETVKDFSRVRQAKIVVAMRLDLLERVFRLTRDKGFQEEKYESLYLPLEWTKGRLVEVLDARINQLIRHHYSGQKVTHRDVIPKPIDGIPSIDYILNRTLMRPRDVIQFFNCCIKQATNKAMITPELIRQAEGEYSRARLKSLADEWYADYPLLIQFANILKSRPRQFPLADITDANCTDFCLDFVLTGAKGEDILSKSAMAVVDEVQTTKDFRRVMIQIFYRVGLVGLKLESYQTFSWGTTGRVSVSPAEITDSTHVGVHPAFWRVLGICDR